MFLCHISLLQCFWRQKQQHLSEQVNCKCNALEMTRVIYILVKCRENSARLASLDLKCVDGTI